MRISFFILVFLLLGFSTASATSVVAVMDNDEIVIGADSKTTLNTTRGEIAPEGIEKCKIIQTGNLFFVSAGSAGVGKAGLNGYADMELDLKMSIAEGLRGSEEIAGKVANLEKVLVADLTRLAQEARMDNTAFFLKKFANRPLLAVIIFGMDKGEPALLVRTFRLIVSPSGSLSFEILRYDCPGDCRTSFIAIFEGQTEAIRTYLREHGLFLHFADPVTAVRDLVELEISETPSYVGPPVDILRLSRKGAEWVQRKPLCPDIQNISVLE